MAKLEGGIFSRPRGKTGGVVFGAARTRTGKVVTSRLLVPPSNPNTTAQQTQRSKFKEALEIVRKIGKAIYGSDWNRSISQLPGFQSMMSIIMNNMDDSYVMSAPPEINLGTLHFPDTFNVITGPSSGIVEIEYSLENGANGTENDPLVAIAIATNPGADPAAREVVVDTTSLRNDEGHYFNGLANGEEYLVIGYFRGAGAASGLLSVASSGVANAGS